jgi:hypothetical protein
MKNKIHPLTDWIPYKLVRTDDALFFEWIYLGDKRFTDPFFDDTIAQCRSLAFNSSGYKVYTTSDNLVQWSEQLTTVPLSGLVFHVSRCGSTMISQLLAVPQSNIVISEAPVIDQILREEQFDAGTKEKLIYAVVRFFGHKRFEEEHCLILKLDAWHLLEIQQFRLLFPDVPFMILYRNPEAVLKSHTQLRGMHMIPGMLPLSMFGLNKKQIEPTSLDHFGVQVLEKYYEAILYFASVDKKTLLADYNEGIENVIISLNIFLAILVSQKSFNGIQERLKVHSKYPENAFAGDKEILLNVDLTIVNNLYGQIHALTTCARVK